ncbi:uncharacterized protein LOC103871872 [Brassica rapa]|uniref:Uncharacterized protein n=2 Tax=Brassica TaxID=3705 RepID=M4F719_BRACM|nr:uncharacterized protein LOC103871872 [Brassica rapa]CAF2151210.1 unnamed protein product [Brassica napus]CDY29752.1 BnaA01g19140D [Brassica napus]
MGNNNATSNLTAEFCSKLATNGMSTLESIPLKTTLDNRSEVLLVSCLKINEVQEATEEINESSNEARLEMRSPSFSNDFKVEERRDKSKEKTQLLSKDKTETDKATLDVEEETVMLKRSETEKGRGFELSLGLSMKPTRRSDAVDSFKETKGSGHNLANKKANTPETLLISSVGSSKARETTEVITESNKEALIQMRCPSFGNDLRTKERSNESMEPILLLCQDKIETYEATINVEKKTVMLKRSESEKTRGFELSLGLSMKTGDTSEADNSLNLKETKDNLLEKKASMEGRVRKRSKSSLFGSCLCFAATAMN